MYVLLTKVLPLLFADPQRRHLVQLQLATKGSSEDARDPAVAASILNWVTANSCTLNLGNSLVLGVNCI